MQYGIVGVVQYLAGGVLLGLLHVLPQHSSDGPQQHRGTAVIDNCGARHLPERFCRVQQQQVHCAPHRFVPVPTYMHSYFSNSRDIAKLYVISYRFNEACGAVYCLLLPLEGAPVARSV